MWHLLPEVCQETTSLFVMRDANGQQLAYLYFENESDRRSGAELLRRCAKGHRRPAGASSNSTAATIGSAPKTSVMMTISIGVPISSGELREGGGYIIGKWKQERQRNRQEQANHGEAKRRQYIGIP
jgi:hypothetical protein